MSGLESGDPGPPKTGKGGSLSKPWWESSVEDESTSKDAGGVNWFKKTATVEEEDEADEQEEGKGGEVNDKALEEEDEVLFCTL